MKLSSTTTDFLDAVINPFDADVPAQVPDLCQFDSLCLTDFLDQFALTNQTAGNTSGVAFMLRTGYSSENASFSSIPGLGYSMLQLDINSSGVLTTSTSTKWTTFLPSNYLTITGSATTYAVNSSLVTAYRIFAMGLRVWPLIETITLSSTTAILNLWCCQMTMAEIQDCHSTGTNFFTLARQSPYTKEYANNQGGCSRLNPFQTDEQLIMQSLPETMAGLGNDTSEIRYPIIVVEFTAPIASAAGYPIKVMAQFWLEGRLQEPTPIYAAASPVDIWYPQIRAAMSVENERYPFCTRGHSFPPIIAALPAIIAALRGAISFSSHMFAAYDKAKANRFKPSSITYPKKNKKKSKGKGRGKKQPPLLAGMRRQVIVAKVPNLKYVRKNK